jgi:DNA polymerase-3 subunit epsilon
LLQANAGWMLVRRKQNRRPFGLERNSDSTKRYVVLDVETTGLSPKNGDRVIEIGAVAIENQVNIAEFSSLIDVDKMIPWRVRQVHGITNEMLSGEPKADEVLPDFYEFIAGSILVAHNASFDIRFLRHEFALLGMSLNNRSLCTLKMSRKQYPHLPNYKLETVGRYLLGSSCMRMQRHRALDDAKLAAMIWLKMAKM